MAIVGAAVTETLGAAAAVHPADVFRRYWGGTVVLMAHGHHPCASSASPVCSSQPITWSESCAFATVTAPVRTSTSATTRRRWCGSGSGPVLGSMAFPSKTVRPSGDHAAEAVWLTTGERKWVAPLTRS